MITEDEKADRINELRTLIQESDKLKGAKIDKFIIEKFLYGTDFDVETGFNKLKNYHEMILEYPHWFPTDGPLDKKSILEKNTKLVIPQYDREGRIIHITKLGNVDVSTMQIDDILAIDDIWFESVTADPRVTQNGICYVVDVANYSMRMLKWVTPENTKLAIKKVLNQPFKDFRFHIINNSMVIHIAIKLVWPFIPSYVKEKIKFHFDDWNSFYTHVDQSVLPPEYGGNYDINYNELYEQLYNRNEEIVRLLRLRRDILVT